MTTTMPERPRWSADDPATRPSARPQASVTVGCGVAHTFLVEEFDVSSTGGLDLDALVVVGLERAGVLSLRGAPVLLNEVVPIESLAAGELQYVTGSGDVGPDHDSFLFSVHSDTGWSVPTVMLVHTVAAERVVYTQPVALIPTALDGAVTTAEGATYVFKPTDFNFLGLKSSFLNVRIASVDTYAPVKLHGMSVTLGQVIQVEDIDLELLTYDAVEPGKEGFEYQVHDGKAWSEAEYSMVIEVESHYLPPTASDSEVIAVSGQARVLQAEDFCYNDFAGDELARVRISNLAMTGSLRLEGKEVESKQVITRAEIDSGQLEYSPAALGGADLLWFRVHDGTAYSVAAYQMQFVVKEAGNTPVHQMPASDEPDDVAVELTKEESVALAREPEPIQPQPVMGGRHFDLMVTAKQDASYVFTVDDLSPDANGFSEIEITSLDMLGLVQLDAMAVTPDQRITREMVADFRLTFLPVGIGKNKYFDFRIRRGLKWSPATCTMWIDIVPGGD